MRILCHGLSDYKSMHQLQKELVEQVRYNDSFETIIICHHNPVVTLGKKTEQGDVWGWQGETVAIERGGRATYHGPGQVVAYPIISLEKRNKDIYKYLRALENAMVLALAEYGITAAGDPDNTGVWVGGKKIASIGVALKRWVTWHGLALNLEKDPQAFQGISPCGFETSTMTTVEECLGRKIDRETFESLLALKLTEQFDGLISADFPSTHV